MLEKYQSRQIYKAIINSNHCVLTGVNSVQTGKKLVIQYKINFHIGQDLPFIKITHTIPNHKFHADSIINLDSEINILQSKITINKKYLEDEKKKIDRETKDFIDLASEIDILEVEYKKISKVKTLELRKAQILEKIDNNTENLKKYKAQISKKEDDIKEDESIIVSEKDNLLRLKNEHKKLALLIFDQLEKSIPQSLYEFINIAYDLEKNKFLYNEKSEAIQVQSEQKKNFNMFNQRYSEVKDYLRKMVIDHIKKKD